MKVDYHREPIGNFGDDLNLWLWPRVIPDLLDDDGTIVLIGVGTILDRGVPERPLKVVLGSGVGYGRLPTVDRRWAPYAVRGPLSANSLGLDPALAIADPGILVPSAAPAEAGDPVVPVSFVPNHASPVRARIDGWDLATTTEAAGVHYIDPAGSVDEVARDLRSSRLVLTEAMHGAILADAYRVPWVALQVFPHVLPFKWWDWALTLGLRYEPVTFDALASDRPADGFTALLEEARAVEPMLSRDAAHESNTKRLMERLDLLRRDLQSGRLMDQARAADAAPEATTRYADLGWAEYQDRQTQRWVRAHRSLRDAAAMIDPGAGLLLADDERFGTGETVAGRRIIPFLEHAPGARARPIDDTTAIEGLERLRAAGTIELAVFAWSTFKWLRRSRRFDAHLRSRYAVLAEDEDKIVFDLRTVAKRSVWRSLSGAARPIKLRLDRRLRGSGRA